MSRLPPESRNSGYTLFEVIVAMTLGLVLMGSVWTMFNLVTRRQIAELERAERNQILRGLHQQLTLDFQSLAAIDGRQLNSWELTPFAGQSSSGLPSGTSAVAGGNVGLALNPGGAWGNSLALVGDSQSLQIEVTTSISERRELSQMLHSSAPTSPSREASSTTIEAQNGTSAPSFKRVRYRWVPPTRDAEDASESSNSETNSDTLGSQNRSSGSSSSPAVETDEKLEAELDSEFALTGLLREESVELWDRTIDSGSVTNNNSSSAAVWDFFSGDSNTGDSAWAPESTAAPREVVTLAESIPEIERLELAYFDGQDWRSRWDSRSERDLPVGLRVRVTWSAPQSARHKNASHRTVDREEDVEEDWPLTDRRSESWFGNRPEDEVDEFKDTPLGENETEFYFSLRPSVPFGGISLTDLPAVGSDLKSSEQRGSRLNPAARLPSREELP